MDKLLDYLKSHLERLECVRKQLELQADHVNLQMEQLLQMIVHHQNTEYNENKKKKKFFEFRLELNEKYLEMTKQFLENNEINYIVVKAKD